MTGSETFIFIGIDWSDVERPLFRLLSTETARTQFVPAVEADFGFRVCGPVRHCCGWFDLTHDKSEYVPCKRNETITTGLQCHACRSLEGFVAVHHAEDASRLPKNVAAYMSRPHQVYIDVFGDLTTKVGTVAESRLGVRLAEQGAFAATYLARTTDGIKARELENLVSNTLKLTQALSTRAKFLALQSTIDEPTIRGRLQETSQRARDLLKSAFPTGYRVEVFEEPRSWDIPACSAAAYANVPAVAYPFSLLDGSHSFRAIGITGSLLLVRGVDADDNSVVVDISPLRGFEISLGDYPRRSFEVQTTLF